MSADRKQFTDLLVKAGLDTGVTESVEITPGGLRAKVLVQAPTGGYLDKSDDLVGFCTKTVDIPWDVVG
jgi:hypothetical protein